MASHHQQTILSLQEFLKQSAASPAVPPCYVCGDQKEPRIPINSGMSALLPTIDMSRLLMPESAEDELQKLHSTCQEWGFFQVVNHGVHPSLIRKLKYEIEEFFKLPLEEKMKYQRRGDDVEGYGQTIALSQDQKLDWGDRLYMLINPVHERKPYLLPQFPPSLRDTLESYFLELQRMGRILLQAMAMALRMDWREMEETFEDGMQSLRMSYYPPCPQPDLVMGLKSHTDGSALTFLLQVNAVAGLQIKKDGLWIPVNFRPDALVINIGDILEIFSNGVYKSIEHRVMANSMKERISIGVFFSPKLQAEVGPAWSLITPRNPPLFTRIGMQEYIKNFFSRRLDRKTNLEHMRIASIHHHQ